MSSSNDAPMGEAAAADSASSSNKRTTRSKSQEAEHKSDTKRRKYSLNEQDIGRLAELDRAQQLEQEQAWWSRWADPLVSAWLRDYGNQTLTPAELLDPILVNQHLSLLVVDKSAARPKGNLTQALKQLLNVFERHAEHYPDADVEALKRPRTVGKGTAPPPSKDAAGDTPAVEEHDDVRPPPQAAADTPASAPSSARKELFPSASYPTQPSTPRMADLFPALGATRPVLASCPHCLYERGVADDRPFACARCGRRSDLAFGDPINVALRHEFELSMQIQAGAAAAAHAAPASVDSS